MHQIEELKAVKGASKSELRARIAELRANRAQKEAEINSRINELENQYNINKNLSSNLKSLKTNKAKSNLQNPIRLRVEALKKELILSVDAIKIKIRALDLIVHGS